MRVVLGNRHAIDSADNGATRVVKGVDHLSFTPDPIVVE